MMECQKWKSSNENCIKIFLKLCSFGSAPENTIVVSKNTLCIIEWPHVAKKSVKNDFPTNLLKIDWNQSVGSTTLKDFSQVRRVVVWWIVNESEMRDLSEDEWRDSCHDLVWSVVGSLEATNAFEEWVMNRISRISEWLFCFVGFCDIQATPHRDRAGILGSGIQSDKNGTSSVPAEYSQRRLSGSVAFGSFNETIEDREEAGDGRCESIRPRLPGKHAAPFGLFFGWSCLREGPHRSLITGWEKRARQ